ncbi:hypothetical protein SCLCIDRAFT_606896 [Scleroderma citrinum Foug A]|uniref:Uncharacterized protein n=1 Tax=Scleroderma citrinum Foug A TaxID=1036808 RepID=A0A0C3D6N8_9AGAM|nr:hypothetical protein SCLCIDRAFT_606896 [Scleroderma citrinum Foug A]
MGFLHPCTPALPPAFLHAFSQHTEFRSRDILSCQYNIKNARYSITGKGLTCPHLASVLPSPPPVRYGATSVTPRGVPHLPTTQFSIRSRILRVNGGV